MRRGTPAPHGPARTDGDPASAAFFPRVILGISAGSWQGRPRGSDPAFSESPGYGANALVDARSNPRMPNLDNSRFHPPNRYNRADTTRRRPGGPHDALRRSTHPTMGFSSTLGHARSPRTESRGMAVPARPSGTRDGAMFCAMPSIPATGPVHACRSCRSRRLEMGWAPAPSATPPPPARWRASGSFGTSLWIVGMRMGSVHRSRFSTRCPGRPAALEGRGNGKGGGGLRLTIGCRWRSADRERRSTSPIYRMPQIYNFLNAPALELREFLT